MGSKIELDELPARGDVIAPVHYFQMINCHVLYVVNAAAGTYVMFIAFIQIFVMPIYCLKLHLHVNARCLFKSLCAEIGYGLN